MCPNAMSRPSARATPSAQASTPTDLNPDHEVHGFVFLDWMNLHLSSHVSVCELTAWLLPRPPVKSGSQARN